MKKLPPKQRLFLKEWAIDKNETQAYIRAYKYKGKQARSLGHKLYAKLYTMGFIEPEIQAQEQKAIITADRVLTELARLATCDISLAFDANGNLLDIKDMPEDVRRAIAGIEIEEEKPSIEGAKSATVSRTKKIKFWDKNKSLETIARHLKMLTDKVELSGKLSLENLIAGSMGKKDDEHKA